MKILVCGGRDYSDGAHVSAVLDAIHAETPVTMLIEGGAKGVDELAARWANARHIYARTFWANWHGLGRAAGPIRNQRMLDEGKPDLVVAFFGGRGTADMVRRAEAAGVEVRRV